MVYTPRLGGGPFYVLLKKDLIVIIWYQNNYLKFMGKISLETSYLYAVPNFLNGIAQTLDMGSTIVNYNGSDSPEDADFKALANDWKAVGKDLVFSMKQYEKEQKK